MNMNSITLGIIIITMLLIVIIIIYSIFIMRLSARNIFQGSGKPISMAKIVLSSIHITAQILFGILVIGIISIMIVENKVESQAGLPIISGIIGYLLGKSFKDVYDSGSNNTKRSTKVNEV